MGAILLQKNQTVENGTACTQQNRCMQGFRTYISARMLNLPKTSFESAKREGRAENDD